jgi:hypothetical protein
MIGGKKISVTTGCLDRLDNLKQALSSWIAFPEIDEIVVVDWNNKTPLVESLIGFRDSRIVIARVVDQPDWRHSKCNNLQLRLATGDVLLRIDSDCVLRSDFFSSHPLTEGMFYAGNWRLAPNTNEASLNGTMYIYRSDVLKVGGYNERLLHYGYEDDDLYERLVIAGLRRVDLNLKTIHHIPHSFRSRHENQGIGAGSAARTEEEERDFLLKLIDESHVQVERQKKWSSEDSITPWKTTRIESDRGMLIECVEVVGDRTSVFEDVVFTGELDGRTDFPQKFDEKAPVARPPSSDGKIYSSSGEEIHDNLVALLFRTMRNLGGIPLSDGEER